MDMPDEKFREAAEVEAGMDVAAGRRAAQAGGPDGGGQLLAALLQQFLPEEMPAGTWLERAAVWRRLVSQAADAVAAAVREHAGTAAVKAIAADVGRAAGEALAAELSAEIRRLDVARAVLSRQLGAVRERLYRADARAYVVAYGITMRDVMQADGGDFVACRARAKQMPEAARPKFFAWDGRVYPMSHLLEGQLRDSLMLVDDILAAQQVPGASA